jgi:chromate reductase
MAPRMGTSRIGYARAMTLLPDHDDPETPPPILPDTEPERPKGDPPPLRPDPSASAMSRIPAGQLADRDKGKLRIGYIIGSTSSSSINRRLMTELVELDRSRDASQLEFQEIRIADLGVYDREFDDAYPAPAVRLKERIRSSDGLVICTPEYNRSIPGALKNAIDWASRPYGDSAFAGKPVGIIGASVGSVGTAVGQQHLRTILAYLDAPMLGQPEAFIEYDDLRFDGEGHVRDPSTRSFLLDWLTALEQWVATMCSDPQSQRIVA